MWCGGSPVHSSADRSSRRAEHNRIAKSGDTWYHYRNDHAGYDYAGHDYAGHDHAADDDVAERVNAAGSGLSQRDAASVYACGHLRKYGKWSRCHGDIARHDVGHAVEQPSTRISGVDGGKHRARERQRREYERNRLDVHAIFCRHDWNVDELECAATD